MSQDSRRRKVLTVSPQSKQAVAWRRAVLLLVSAGLALLLALVLIWEAKTSFFQAQIASWVASQLSYRVEPGASDASIFPANGPYDKRLGYSLLPDFIEKLKVGGYTVSNQARLSPLHLSLIRHGLFPIYREKSEAGIVINDSKEHQLYSLKFPVLSYDSFEDVPPLVVETLLYIENRKLLDDRFPYRNPAVESSRLIKAIMEQLGAKVFGQRKTAGGSTLATQIEKFRHSVEGRTVSPGDKLRQMLTATLRAYMNGVDTRAARREIVLEFINSVPLGAIPGQGQVIGLASSLKAWYGVDLEVTNKLLALGAHVKGDEGDLPERAMAFKQMLSLFLSQRRPTYYLQTSLEALNRLCNIYVALMAKDNIVSSSFREAVLATDLKFADRRRPQQPERKLYLERKAANSIRIHLLRLFGLRNLYELDRLDLRVNSTFDYDVQRAVSNFLTELHDPRFAEKAGLNTSRVLNFGSGNDAIFSLTLLEHVGDTNVVRVQTDSLAGPFNVNEGGKLELGSTAKLRTLVTYLEIISDLHDRFASMSPTELAALKPDPADQLTLWALTYMKQADDKGLTPMLAAAMERRYSGSTEERFFTGGGIHKFGNFEPEEDLGTWSVTQSLQKSINLPFVRLLRDVVQFYIAKQPNYRAIFSDQQDPRRRIYLERFAHKEGRSFLVRFYNKYRGKTAAEIYSSLPTGGRGWPKRFAAIYRSVFPNADLQAFSAAVRKQYSERVVSDAGVKRLYEQLDPQKIPLVDRAYLARVHPLELWLVGYWQTHQQLSLGEAIEASRDVRLEVYGWLFETKNREKQTKRLQIMLEDEAFGEIHKDWHRLGFPFGALVPSLATALGSSGDRPLALAELIGIILNNGRHYPTLRIRDLQFGSGTPYEILMTRTPPPSQQLLRPEIAAVVKDALIKVVDGGTAVRVKDAFLGPDGSKLPIGGKTGTGDNRYQAFGPGGRTVNSRVISRTATFVFFIGERFFGTIVVHVPTAAAANYRFTSALPVQVLKALAPTLNPLLLEKSR